MKEYDNINITVQINEIKLDKYGCKDLKERDFNRKNYIRDIETFVEINGQPINHYTSWYSFVIHSDDNRSHNDIERKDLRNPFYL
jgi:hypothetical protein